MLNNSNDNKNKINKYSKENIDNDSKNLIKYQYSQDNSFPKYTIGHDENLYLI